MRNVWIWIVVLAVIIGGGVWWYESSQSAPAIQDQSGTQTTQTTGTTPSSSQTNSGDQSGTSVNVGGSVSVGAPKTVTVTYDGSSFSPSTITISKGDTVKFVDSAGSMWVASDPHPVHNGYDGTSRNQHCAPSYSGPKPFDECAAGNSFTFIFNKTGSWGYHDHMNADAGGTVVVQ